MKKQLISTTRLAEICGVSQGTVDRALNDRKGISPATKARILEVAKQYGYRPNIHARCMAGGRSMLIGVVVFDLWNDYFAELLTDIEQQCREKGYATVVMFSHKDPTTERECIETLYSMHADGIILCPAGQGEAYENFLLSLQMPIVTVGNTLSKIPYIGMDNRIAAMDAVRTAKEAGCEHLVFIMPRLKDGVNASAQTGRRAGFEQAAKDMAYCICHSAQEAMESRKDGCKTAFICSTDVYAPELLRLTEKTDDMVIGFDNLRLIQHFGYTMHTVVAHGDTVAKTAVESVINGTADSVHIPHKLMKI